MLVIDFNQLINVVFMDIWTTRSVQKMIKIDAWRAPETFLVIDLKLNLIVKNFYGLSLAYSLELCRLVRLVHYKKRKYCSATSRRDSKHGICRPLIA